MDSADFTSELLTQHSGFLRALAQGILKDEQLAEDAVQDAMVASLETPREATPNLVAWLFTVTRHAAIRIQRGANRRRNREAAMARSESQTSSIEDLDRAEMLSRITSAVVALPDPYRSVLLARYYQGLPPAAIAAREGIPLATIKSRLARAHSLIRERLDRTSGGDRTQWHSGLLALLGRRSASVEVALPAPLILSLLAMKTKLALGLLVVALLALAFVEFRADRGQGPAAGPLDPSATASRLKPTSPVANARPEPSRVAAIADSQVAAATGIDHEKDLRILVVATDGTPIADATVVIVHPGARQLPGLVEDSGELDQQVAQGRSDSSGQCGFQLEPRRHYDVTASAPGFARICSRSRYPGLELRMVLPRAATLVGSVTNAADGSPVAGARVQARLGVVQSLAEDGFEAETDARGHFELGELPADATELLTY
ncbi:MAG: sigma-70 family RNA polymerase sigma factor, partial [Planctomycetota bacterium]